MLRATAFGFFQIGWFLEHLMRGIKREPTDEVLPPKAIELGGTLLWRVKNNASVGNMAFTELRGNNHTLRVGPVNRDAPDLLEAERVSSEIRAEVSGIFAPDEKFARAVDQQRRPRPFGRAVAIGTALPLKCLGDPLRRVDLPSQAWNEDGGDAKSRTWGHVFNATRGYGEHDLFSPS